MSWTLIVHLPWPAKDKVLEKESAGENSMNGNNQSTAFTIGTLHAYCCRFVAKGNIFCQIIVILKGILVKVGITGTKFHCLTHLLQPLLIGFQYIEILCKVDATYNLFPFRLLFLLFNP